jgi:hypothetical protein
MLCADAVDGTEIAGRRVTVKFADIPGMYVQVTRSRLRVLARQGSDG